MPILIGQTYSGTLSRYCFPPDADEWWNGPGSYEVVIDTVGRIWFTYRSFRVYRDGQREPIQTPGGFRKARLKDLEQEIAAGILTLNPAAPEHTIEYE